MTLYKNRYRIESARLKTWDYTRAGYYFITICTSHRACYFGEVNDGKMILSDTGRLAYQFWAEIPKHFLSVSLDEFVIMPNHMHGILVLSPVETLQCNVSTVPDRNVSTATPQKNQQMARISPKPGSVSTIIRSYKSIVTRTVRQKYPGTEFGWQSRFYDRIVRTEAELTRLRTYIKNNAAKWSEDSLYQ